MRDTNALDWVAIVLVIIGALNWGLVGFFDYNLVDGIFGIGSVLSRIIYALVGLAGLYTIALAARQSSGEHHHGTAMQH